MNKVSGVCPFLGLYDDGETRYDYASPANCCHTRRPPLPVEPAYQRRYCLTDGWSTCGLYRAAQADGVVDRSAAGRSRRGLVMSVTAIAAIVTAFVLLLRAGIINLDAASALLALAGNGNAESTGIPAEVTIAPTEPAISPVGSDQGVWPHPDQQPTRVALAAPASSTPEPTATQRPTDAPTATPSLTPSTTSTFTLTPTDAPTATATPSPTASPTPSPTPTLRPTSVPVYRPAPTRTQYSAPTLLAPASGQSFGTGATIVLQWQSVGTLARDEYYVISLWYSHGSEIWYDETPWTRETSWTASDHDYLPGLSNDGRFSWSVRVVRQTGTDAAGRLLSEPASPPSATFVFNWARAPEKTAPAPPP